MLFEEYLRHELNDLLSSTAWWGCERDRNRIRELYRYFWNR